MSDALSNVKSVYLAARAYVEAELAYRPYGTGDYPIASESIHKASEQLRDAIESDQPGWDPNANTDASSVTAVTAYAEYMCHLADAYVVTGVGTYQLDTFAFMSNGQVYGSADYPNSAYTNPFVKQLSDALQADNPGWTPPVFQAQ